MASGPDVIYHPAAVAHWATKLRKHVATITQLCDFSENDQDGLARFLGHDIRIHRDFYRLEEDAFIVAKMSKVLYTLEKGYIEALKGKSLDKIELSGKVYKPRPVEILPTIRIYLNN